MIILCTYKEASKKSMKDASKVIASATIEKTDLKRAVTTGEFLPNEYLFSQYINGYISKKEYKKKYIKSIINNEGAFTSLLTIMLLYKRGDHVALVCDEEEVEFKYLQFLAEFLSERYGLDICTYDTVKKKGLDKIKNHMSKKGEKTLKRDLKEYRDELRAAQKALEKSKKKKSKKHSKKKDKKKDKKKKKKGFEITYSPKSYSSQLYAPSDVSERFQTVTIKKLFKNR